jgi:hypothetical protein
MIVPSKRSLYLMKEIKATVQYIPFNNMYGVTCTLIRVKCTEKQPNSNFGEITFRIVSKR